MGIGVAEGSGEPEGDSGVSVPVSDGWPPPSGKRTTGIRVDDCQQGGAGWKLIGRTKRLGGVR